VANYGINKRKYATLSIPERVALRLHEKLGIRALEGIPLGSHLPRIIHRSDVNAEMSKKPQSVIRLRPIRFSRSQARFIRNYGLIEPLKELKISPIENGPRVNQENYQLILFSPDDELIHEILLDDRSPDAGLA